jgi:hypothetical protein
VREPAPVPSVYEQGDVVGAAEAIGAQRSNTAKFDSLAVPRQPTMASELPAAGRRGCLGDGVPR